MQKVWATFGFNPDDTRNPFEEARPASRSRQEAKPYDPKFKPRRGGDRAK
jgi:hypothetical protein